MVRSLIVDTLKMRELYYDLKHIALGEDSDPGFSELEREVAAERLVQDIQDSGLIGFGRSPLSIRSEVWGVVGEVSSPRALGENPYDLSKGKLSLAEEPLQEEPVLSLVSARELVTARSLADIMVSLEEIITRPGIFDTSCDDEGATGFGESCGGRFGGGTLVNERCSLPTLKITIDESEGLIRISAEKMVSTYQRCEYSSPGPGRFFHLTTPFEVYY